MKNDEVLKSPPNGRRGFQLSSCDSRVQNASHTLSTSLLSQQNGRPYSGTGIKLPTTLFNCANRSLEQGPKVWGKEPKAELSLQINSRDFQDRRSSRTSNSSSRSLSQSFPWLREERPGALVSSASASYSSNWRERGEGQRSLGTRSLPAPRKVR